MTKLASPDWRRGSPLLLMVEPYSSEHRNSRAPAHLCGNFVSREVRLLLSYRADRIASLQPLALSIDRRCIETPVAAQG
jgi:hypothetical protein